MAIKRMDNVGIVVDNLDVTVDFFREVGLELEGRGMLEGEWAGRVTGLGDQRVEVAMMRTPVEYLRTHQGEILLAGGLRSDPQSAFTGSLWVLDVATQERAVELAEG